MRIFVVFEGSRLNLDIKPDDAVRKVKNIVKKKMLINTQEDKKQGKILDVKFGGDFHFDFKYIIPHFFVIYYYNYYYLFIMIDKIIHSVILGRSVSEHFPGLRPMSYSFCIISCS